MSNVQHQWEYLCTQTGKFLFPAYCLGCGASGTLLCQPCGVTLHHPPTKCLLCTRPILGGICRDCAQKTSLERIDAYAPYRNPLARALVGHMKYQFEYALAHPIGDVLASIVGSLTPNTLLVPIPLHKKKLRERGFNQSALIARHIGDTIHIPVDTSGSFLRTIYTPPQARTATKKERKEHLKSAFSVIDPHPFFGKHIVLVDDVITSGATIREAARALKQASPASIRVLAFSYG